jgi:hypothetical protein
VCHWKIGNIARPDLLVGPFDRYAGEQIRIDRRPACRDAGPWSPVQCLNAHPAHQRRDVAPADLVSLAPQPVGELARTVERQLRNQASNDPCNKLEGDVLYAYPYIPGTETQWAGWNYYGKPNSRLPPRLANMDLPGQHAGYLADETVRHNIDALSFDFDLDSATLSRSRRIYDATSLDLRVFKAKGGKILMWHGWADGAIMATSSIGYYESVSKLMGGRDKTVDFFRLFLVPGVHHGGGGPRLTELDLFSALENWVERAQVPDKLIASRLNNGVVERTRPIYPYPVLARYSGKGDPKQAVSLVPFDPSRR